jgi:hypothetical protein
MPYKIDADEIQRDKEERGKTEDSYLLGRSREHWQRFINEDKLDESALVKRYRAEQLPYIRSELEKRRWIN